MRTVYRIVLDDGTVVASYSSRELAEHDLDFWTQRYGTVSILEVTLNSPSNIGA
jgi:hypothetical protein